MMVPGQHGLIGSNEVTAMNTLVQKLFLLIGILTAIGSAANGQWLVYNQIDTMPYFSLHPPVYYGRHVARTYGVSPFAMPPGGGYFDVGMPRECHNSDLQPERREIEPLRIDNPFVIPDSTGEVTGVQQRSVRRPQRVYPVSMQKNGTILKY
jgi:hypothetical protein